jgi:hypothetical protein
VKRFDIRNNGVDPDHWRDERGNAGESWPDATNIIDPTGDAAVLSIELRRTIFSADRAAHNQLVQKTSATSVHRSRRSLRTTSWALC